MNIFVNDQQLDARLSGEKNLGEVYEQVNRWSAENKKYILSMQVDSKDVAVSNLKDIPVEGVDRFDFFIGDEMDMLISTMEELDRYVDQIGSTLYEMEEVTGKEVTDLREGCHWITQIMNSVSVILKIDLNRSQAPLGGEAGEESGESLGTILERLEQRAVEFEQSGTRDSIEAFLGDLRALKYFVMKLQLQLRAMHTGLEELVETVEEFEQKIPELGEEAISINAGFNEGRDQKALDLLERFTERLNIYLSALFALDYRLGQEKGESLTHVEVEGVPMNEHSSSLTELLQELSGALEENDIVAVGDILEYEMTEKLKLLQPYLTKIRQLVVVRN